MKDRGEAGAPGSEHRRGPKRVFDRHSGTGRDPTENKKGGAGRSNWGAAGKDDLAAVIDAATEPAAADDKEAAEAVSGDAAAPAEGAEAAAAAAPAEGKGKDREHAAPAHVEEDPDDKNITFEEFEKKQAAERAALKKLKLPKARSAGEGVKPNPQWDNAVPLKREEETSLPNVTLKPKKETKKAAAAATEAQAQPQQPTKKTRKEETISAADIIRFDTSRRGDREGGERSGRGGFGRGGSRGGGERRGPREGAAPGGADRRPRREGAQGSPAQAPRAEAPKKAAAEAPAISDASLFPALGL
jgi:chemotaxis protein histidine kinase CheA